MAINVIQAMRDRGKPLAEDFLAMLERYRKSVTNHIFQQSSTQLHKGGMLQASDDQQSSVLGGAPSPMANVNTFWADMTFPWNMFEDQSLTTDT